MIFVTNDDQLGKNIRYLRQKENFSQQDFARLFGVTSGTLEALETGNLLEIDAKVLLEICRSFQLEIKTLVEDCLE